MTAIRNPQLTGGRIANETDTVALITRTLLEQKGNVAGAARALNMSKRTLFRWIKQYTSMQDALSSARKEAEGT